jgi:hypothetical protein
MRPLNKRQTVNEIKRLCRARGIEVEIVPARGGGSHEALVFKDTVTGEAVQLTIANHKDISPGVQRKILQWAAEKAIRMGIAEIVRQILDQLFK